MSWPVATIGEVCEVVSGATPKTGRPEFWDGNVPWVTPKDLSELGQKHLSDTPRQITKAGLKSCSARMLPAQSVLFSSRAPIGLVAINTLPVCTNQGFKSLVPRFDLISPDFLFWWLKTQEKHIQSKGRGATFKEVSKKIVEDLQIPLPPLAEQKRIAGILDAAALFLADRVSLVNQAIAAFKAHLPESSPVNLVAEKDKAGRVYVSTYPTMMGLIDETDGNEARFSVGHFDLVIIDEAHRSVYEKYGAIFRYFDSLLVGLTATPSDHIDRNTYTLFDLEPGVPTDAYELETAVADGFLVPHHMRQVDLKFPREGIDYDSLSEEEQEQWESLDWGDDVDENGLPDKVNAAAINSWLFNEDTVDKALQHLMERGHRVEGDDRLAKTILFARNHQHAKFIEERFNHHYPHYKGHFARIIDHYATYPQSLLDDFSQKNKPPHIAISVDMLDTGIDVPEVANLVFFKPVYSKIKFWQMIGRGTRLCSELFGPDNDKQDFRVFDFCFNFDFFRENPQGMSFARTRRAWRFVGPCRLAPACSAPACSYWRTPRRRRTSTRMARSRSH